MEVEGEEDIYLPGLKVSSMINNLMPCPFSLAFVLHRPAAMGQHTPCSVFFSFLKRRFWRLAGGQDL